jgi:large subunit ribosomal protein L5e
MPFVKIQKNKAYFKRYQVKFRRRREGKTDFYARRRLIVQDKNKYSTPKYRLVVRFTNQTVICQIAYATTKGDHVICSAYSSELPRYGLKVGLKNYAAAYCTGLLCARRLLHSKGLAEAYPGVEEVDACFKTTTGYGETGKPKTHFVADLDEERRPFRCYLDVGIRSTTTGARVFGALKGAVDGGLDVPHNEKRFPGYDHEAKKYNPEMHRERIFGQHVAEYMTQMQEKDAERYKAHFNQYIAFGIEADQLEDLYEKVHEAIRADPARKEKAAWDGDRVKYKNPAKKSLAERRGRIQQKRDWLARKNAAEAEELDMEEDSDVEESD